MSAKAGNLSAVVPGERIQREAREPIHRSLTIGCGVWVPAYAKTTKMLVAGLPD